MTVGNACGALPGGAKIMKIKLMTTALLMAIVAIPVLAQNEDTTNNEESIPTHISEKKGMGRQRSNADMEKIRDLRQAAKAKKEKAKQFKSKVANEHRSAVANFVHELLDVADRQALGGIGEQVREIARQQNASEDKVGPKLEKVKNKNKIRKFFFGTYFGETRAIKKEMQSAQKRLRELERIKDGVVANPEDKAVLEAQIQNFKDNINKVLSEVEEEEGKFSLFGWVKKIFVK